MQEQQFSPNGILLPLDEQSHKILDAIRVMCAPETQKVSIIYAASFLTATVLSRVPYARRKDVQKAVVCAGWEMALRGQMPGHFSGVNRGVYAGRCAARFLLMSDSNDDSCESDDGTRPRFEGKGREDI